MRQAAIKSLAQQPPELVDDTSGAADLQDRGQGPTCAPAFSPGLWTCEVRAPVAFAALEAGRDADGPAPELRFA